MENIISSVSTSQGIRDSLSNLILSGGSANVLLDSILSSSSSSSSSCCSSNSINNNNNNTKTLEPLGCSVYLKQRDLILHKFLEQDKSSSSCYSLLSSGSTSPSTILPMKTHIDHPCNYQTLYSSSSSSSVSLSVSTSRSSSNTNTNMNINLKKKVYRGVRQRQWGRWVAEIRLPQNRMRVWLGTYDSPEAAAFAYDTAAYKLRREYARLNFPNLKDPTIIIGDSAKLNALKSAVDSKIQAICKRVILNKKGNHKEINVKKKCKQSYSTTAGDGGGGGGGGCGGDHHQLGSSPQELLIQPQVHPVQVRGDHYYHSLARMPSFDSDLIWQILAN